MTETRLQCHHCGAGVVLKGKAPARNLNCPRCQGILVLPEPGPPVTFEVVRSPTASPWRNKRVVTVASGIGVIFCIVVAGLAVAVSRKAEDPRKIRPEAVARSVAFNLHPNSFDRLDRDVMMARVQAIKDGDGKWSVNVNAFDRVHAPIAEQIELKTDFFIADGTHRIRGYSVILSNELAFDAKFDSSRQMTMFEVTPRHRHKEARCRFLARELDRFVRGEVEEAVKLEGKP